MIKREIKKEINYYKGKMRTPQFSQMQAQPAIQNFRVIGVNKQTKIIIYLNYTCIKISA